MKATFFPTAATFRRWLKQRHATDDELWVGYYKKGSRKASITWPESVDQALCFGWIDGLRRSIDEVGYAIRFTPRRPGSIWSSINIKRARILIEQGRMQPAGLRAYHARKENKSGIYSYEQRRADLPAQYNRLLKRNKAAWGFLRSQPPSYRKVTSWWIISAKREATRLKRLEALMAYSVRRQRVPAFDSRTPPR